MELGLLLTALGLGLRHGIDWDHIAAIADLSGTAQSRRRGFVLSMIYAAGHGLVVFVLGTFAIAFGLAIPDRLDSIMGRIIGVTLIALGVWIIVELARKGRSFRLRSRWMLVLDGTFAGLRKVRRGAASRSIGIEHEHEHEHGAGGADVDPATHAQPQAHDHAHDRQPAASVPPLAEVNSARRATGDGWGTRLPWVSGRRHHHHPHRHELALATSATARYGHGTAAGIGMLHGIGVESPTQIAIFVASTSVAGVGFGLTLLAMWVAGLLVANAAIAVAAGAGLLHAERSFPVYATVAVTVSVLSIGLGVLYLVGLDVLPGIVI